MGTVKEKMPAKKFDDFYTPSKKHILAIDDDRTVLSVIKEILTPEYDVTCIASSKMAEAFLESKHVDLILLDYDMPDISGPMIFRNLKGNPKTENIPVVFLSGVTDVSLVTHVLSYKPNGYLLKPVDADRLVKTIKEVFGES